MKKQTVVKNSNEIFSLNRQFMKIDSGINSACLSILEGKESISNDDYEELWGYIMRSSATLRNVIQVISQNYKGTDTELMEQVDNESKILDDSILKIHDKDYFSETLG